MENKFESGGKLCILCPDKTSAPPGKDQVEIAGFLKNLLQFLNVDSSKFLLSHGTMRPKGRLEGAMAVEVLAENICHECSSLVNIFGGVYQDYEMIKQLLKECVQQLGDRIRSGPSASVFERVENGGWDDVGGLKAEILKQCMLGDLMLEGVPKSDLVLEGDARMEDDEQGIGTGGGETTLEEMEGESESRLDENTSIYEDNNSHDISRILSNDSDLRHILGVNQGLMEQLSEVVSAHVTWKRESTTSVPVNNVTPMKELKPAVPQPQMLSSPSPTTCLYCGVSLSYAWVTVKHMMCVHPAQYFSTEFPAGTTEEDVTEAIRGIVEEGHIIGSGGQGVPKGKVLCSLCTGVGMQTAVSMKCHLLEQHRDELRSRLTPNEINDTSSGVAAEPAQPDPEEQGRTNRRLRSSKRLIIQRPHGSSNQNQAQAHHLHHLKQIAGKGITRAAPLKCKICGKVCVNEKWLKGHMLHHIRRSTTTTSSARQNPSDAFDTAAGSALKLGTGTGTSSSCLYCGITLSTEGHCHNHMLTAHPTAYCAQLLPPGTTPSQMDSAIDVVINETAKIIMTSRRQYYNCRLCSKVCHMGSRRLHVMQRHLPVVASTLKAMFYPN